MTEKEERASSQARAQLDSILEMVAALEVDYDRLEELRADKQDRLDNQDEYEATDTEGWEADEGQELKALLEAAGDCESREDAEQRIQEDPLSVEVRSGWHTPGSESEAEEFMILLCTGGPAVRIVGELGQWNEPERASLEYQDWFTPWERYPLTSEEEEAVLTYCRCFWFGE